ncbi:MAG TPA: hypothetical protein VG733_14550 [Chthoniobacteraceae bacterium]|nr:hypothetical protein [Chthoniobacteraceae bacterium]
MPQAENPPTKILAQPLAIGLGAALLFGYAVVTVHAIYEKQHRTSIERVNAAYAVGDTTYFPKQFDTAKPLVNFDGHSLFYVDHTSQLDSAMVRVGADDSGVYGIYKLSTAKEDASIVYLKVAPNDFIKATRK